MTTVNDPWKDLASSLGNAMNFNAMWKQAVDNPKTSLGAVGALVLVGLNLMGVHIPGVSVDNGTLLNYAMPLIVAWIGYAAKDAGK